MFGKKERDVVYVAAFIFFVVIVFLFVVILKISLTIVLLYFLKQELISYCLGSRHSTQLVETQTRSKNKQRRCRFCTKKTCYTWGKCSKPGHLLLLCKEGLREFLGRFHNKLLYGLPSSISQQSGNSPE